MQLLIFSPDLSPSSNEIMTETSAGVWFGTANRAVALVHNGSIEFFGRQEGLTADRVNFVYRDSEGSIWIGTTLGLDRFREPLAYVMSGADGIPPGMPSFLYQDSRNGLWLGTYQKTVRIEEESGRKQTFDSHYLCIGEDRSGRTWFATASDLGYLRDGRFVAVRDSSGARIPNVNALRADAEGFLWAPRNFTRSSAVARSCGYR